MREIPPWLQMALFVVVVLLLALPVYTAFPRGWAAIGLVAWAVSLCLMIRPPWGSRERPPD